MPGKTNDDQDSIFLKTIWKGKDQGLLTLSDDESKITYHGSRDFTTSFRNPEEKVRGAYFVELVSHYRYPREKIAFEVEVPRRTPSDWADIVVFEDDELKAPYLVVECKRDGVSDAEFDQAVEQAFGNANSLRAKYAVVVAGTTRRHFYVAGYGPSERGKNIVSDIAVKYGKAPKYRLVKGDMLNDLRVVSRDELIRALEKSHDTVWQGGKLAPTAAFDEVAKLLFCKLKDEKETKKKVSYKFQVGSHETPDDVFKRVNTIYQKAKQGDSEVFKDDIRLEPRIVFSVVEHLQEIAFARTDLDVKGVAFERFIQEFFRGKMGQFFTPRQIVRFCVKMLNPGRGNLVLDPAAGSGGFLLEAMDNVKKTVEEHHDEREAWEHWHNFAMRNLYGIEINDQIARVCKMNMIVHDDGHTNIISLDSLQHVNNITSHHKGFRKDHFDLILTNPPFGATVKEAEKGEGYLGQFELAAKKKNQKTEILFIERCVDFVKPGSGRIAIVLPDGILTNSSLQYVRDFIMEKCQVLAVVSLPQFAFSHFGAGVKSSLVFLRRKAEGEKLGNYPIFMAIAEHIGYDATGREDPLNDLYEADGDGKLLDGKGIIGEYRKFLESPHFYQGV